MRIIPPTPLTEPKPTFRVSMSEVIFTAHIVSVNVDEENVDCLEVWVVGRTAPYLLDKEKTQEFYNCFPESYF